MAIDSQMLKGVLEGCILALLSGRETYGYRIVEELRDSGFANIQEATVYPILNRLEKKSLISFTKRPSDLGPPRKYFSLTVAGQEYLTSFAHSWSTISKHVHCILEEHLK